MGGLWHDSIEIWSEPLKPFIMNTAKYLLYAALGVAAVLLLTSDRAKEMRDDLEDKAMDKAKKIKDRLAKLRVDSNGLVADLKES